MTIEEFIAARVAEDETSAEQSVRWNEGCRDWADDGNPDWVHIARHDPARVLRQCAALRVLVASAWGCSWCDDDGRDIAALKATAAIWSDHPDYQHEWDS